MDRLARRTEGYRLMAEVSLQSLTAWRADLVESRASGVRTIKHQNGQEITYKSDNEMAAAIRSLDTEISRLANQAPRSIRFNTSKGL